jgi:hypothetical protein
MDRSRIQPGVEIAFIVEQAKLSGGQRRRTDVYLQSRNGVSFRRRYAKCLGRDGGRASLARRKPGIWAHGDVGSAPRLHRPAGGRAPSREIVKRAPARRCPAGGLRFTLFRDRGRPRPQLVMGSESRRRGHLRVACPGPPSRPGTTLPSVNATSSIRNCEAYPNSARARTEFDITPFQVSHCFDHVSPAVGH